MRLKPFEFKDEHDAFLSLKTMCQRLINQDGKTGGRSLKSRQLVQKQRQKTQRPPKTLAQRIDDEKERERLLSRLRYGK